MLRTVLPCLLLLSGCNDLTAPPQAAVDRKPRVEYAAQVDRGESVLVIVDQVYLDCVDEVVSFDAAVPFRYHQTDTPTGKSIRLEPFLPHSGVGTAIGQSSGTVWTLGRVVSPFVLIAGSPGGLLHFPATQQWLSNTGPQLHLFTLVHVSQNAAGEIKAEKVVIDRCQLS